MKLVDILCYTPSNRIDWVSTEKSIVAYIENKYPNEPLSTQALRAADLIRRVHELVRKYGVMDEFILDDEFSGQPNEL